MLAALGRIQPTPVFKDVPLAQDQALVQSLPATEENLSSTIKVRDASLGNEKSTVMNNEKAIVAVKGPHIWLGQKYDMEERQLNSGYVQDRANLSNAAYRGDWSRVFKYVQTMETKYGQRWINCVRMGNNPKYKISGFTPLHHAAYFGASVDVVKRLISMGAWRMARTHREPQKDMTPLDLARSVGYEHLYEVLSPVSRHTILPSTILALQQQLHLLIRHEAKADDRLRYLRLPDLTVLLESEVMEMWFPMTALSAEASQHLASKQCF